MVCQNKAFALIEALAALGILAVVLMAFPALLGTALQTDRLAACLTVGTTLAQEKYEEIRNTPYNDVTTGADASSLTMAGPTAGCTYQRSWTVAAGPTATTKQVTVTVQWQAGTTRRAVVTSIVTQ